MSEKFKIMRDNGQSPPPMWLHPLFFCGAGFAACLFEPVRGNFWAGLIVLGGLICIYGWLARGPLGPGRYEIGDNCYFIGFVYTLLVIALSVGLDEQKIIGASGVKADDDSVGGTGRLLQTVGIALFTSVVGMCCRFGLTHGIKVSENEFDQRVDSVSISVTKLEAAIGAAKQSADYAQESFARAGESLTAVAGNAQLYSDQMLRETGKIGEHMTEVAGKMFDDFGNRIADTLQKTQFDNVREDLQDAVERHRAAAAEIAAVMKQSGETIKSAAQAATAAAESAQKSLRQSADAEEWEKIKRVFAGFSEQIETIGDGLQAVAARQTEMAEFAERDVARLREARDNSASLMKTLEADLAAAVEFKEQYRAELDRAAKTAREETSRLYERLIAGAKIALAQNGELKKLSDALQKVAEHMEKFQK